MACDGNSLHSSRRTFLKTAATGIASAGFAIVPHGVLGSGARAAPSERITLGFIGTGSHGVGVNLKHFIRQPDAQVVALCDVDRKRLDDAKRLTDEYYNEGENNSSYGGCAVTGDWREIVARPDLDAVVISTPDHWHVLPAICAAEAGKDVFCEKPLSLTVREGRILSDTVRREGRVFQTASENRSKSNFLKACQRVRNGRIGKLHTIRVELPEGHHVIGEYGKSPGPEPVPEWFDYDMWLGQAPKAYYTPARCHWNFRWILDYSGGQLTDWGAHMLDLAQWANDSEDSGPVRVKGEGTFPDEGLYNAATKWDIEYEYANGVKLYCKSGTPSIRFEGEDGWIFCTWDTIGASSQDIVDAPLDEDAVQLRTCSGGEQRDFLDCVKSRQATYAPAETGHRTVTIAHIGNIAMMLGRPLKWDPKAERFQNDEAANDMLSRKKRVPWNF